MFLDSMMMIFQNMMRTKDVSEMTDEDLEAVDMESNLDGSEYSDGDTMEPMDGDYSSADFETGVSDESMDAAIDGELPVLQDSQHLQHYQK